MNATHPIDHCGMCDKIDSVMENGDFEEAVLARSGQIVRSAVTGKQVGGPHKLAGVELVANRMASRVLDEGADQVCRDLGKSFDALSKHASSEHISSC